MMPLIGCAGRWRLSRFRNALHPAASTPAAASWPPAWWTWRLQVLDEGRLTDGQGRTVDFRNTVVILTSNLGAGGNREQIMDAVKHHFKPEFINRLDDVVVFEPLSQDQLVGIVDIQLQGLAERLAAGLDRVIDERRAESCLGRILAGITSSSFTSTFAYMADITPPEGRARGYGLIGAAFSAGFVAGPLLGGGFGHFYAYAPVKIEYGIDRYAMEVKRQIDVLDRRLAESRYIAGDDYTIADMAIWPWYGALAKGLIYDAGTFLQVQEYTNLIRWTDELAARPAVQRGRMVNRIMGDPASLLHERHDASDFDTRTQDKLHPAA